MMQRVTVRKTLFFFLSGIAAWWLVSCHSSPQNKATGPEFKIVGGSENSVLVPLLEEFGRAHGVNVTFQESGSVDLMLALQQPATQIPEDAVWPADSLWLEMAGNRDVKMAQSITRTPIVLGVKVSKAKELGIYGKDLGLSEIIKLLQTHKLRFIMTNPTQSNSGCMAYLGFSPSHYWPGRPLLDLRLARSQGVGGNSSGAPVDGSHERFFRMVDEAL